MLPGTPFAASLVQYISIATLFDGCWHPRDRHERLRHLIEQLACVLFFTQRHREELDDLGLAHLHRQVSGSRVSRHLIMLDPLCGPDQGEIGGSIVLFLAFLHDFLSFFDEASHALAGFRTRRRAQHAQAFIESFCLSLGFPKVGFEQMLELGRTGRLCHLR